MTRQKKITEKEVNEWYDEEENNTNKDFFQNIPDPAEKYAKSQLRVVRETKDYQLDYLQHALRPNKELIDTDPGYQRRSRWSNKKRSLLIESLLLNIPIPSVFLFETDYNKYEVIDGRQRIEAIISFLENGFSLTGLEYWPELNSKKFEELPSILQKGLLRRSISAVVLLAETKVIDDDGLDVRRALFDRLNTGGIQLNPQELRNALYPGPLNALLIKLARTDNFTKIWGIPPYRPQEETSPPQALLKNPLYSTLADAELVLRFFALKDAVENNRSGSLRRILDRYMKNNQNINSNTLIDMEFEFTFLLSKFSRAFNDQPFQLPTTKRISRPLYDAMMIALSQKPQSEIEKNSAAVIRKLNEDLRDNDKYDILVGRGNTMDSIRKRVDLASEIISAH